MKPLTIEDIILSDSSRGMENLRALLPPDFCRRAAAALLGLKKGNVLIATGFYVKGHAETDGPPGAYFLARALNACGFHAVVVTDSLCEGLFREIPVEVLPFEVCESQCVALIEAYDPKALISVERCGVNARGEYANMHGESIAAHTAKLDPLFAEGRRRNIPTIGIGDGGNEIGMGNFRDVIERELSLCPCVTEVNYPVIATVSNWGGYSLCACLENLTGRAVMPEGSEVQAYLEEITAHGCVDGMTGQHTPTVDGFPQGMEAVIAATLKAKQVSAMVL